MLNKTRNLTLILILSSILNALAMDRLSLLPPDQIISVRVSNISEFGARLKKSPFGQLWDDPQFQEFAGHPTEQDWADIFFSGDSDAEKEINIDQFKMLKGELIFGMNPGTETLCLIAAMSSEDYLRSLTQDEKLKVMAAEPFEIINDEFQGIKLIRHIHNGGTDEEESFWQAYLAGTLLNGTSREWIEQSIIQLKKQSPTEPEGAPSLEINLKISQLIDEMARETEAAPNDKAVFEALGLTGIGNGSVTLRLDDNQMVLDGTLNITDLTKGIFALLDLQASALPTVTFIPENSSSIGVGRVNLLRFWREIPKIIAAISPEGILQFAMLSGMIQQQAKIDLDQDLLSNLGTQYLSFSVTDPETTQLVSVVGIELKDSFAFRTALETALTAPDLRPQIATVLDEESFLGHTIYNIKNQKPGSQPQAFSIAADRLFYGPPDELRRIIQTQSNADSASASFEHSPLVQGLRKHTPPAAFSCQAIDWTKQLESVLPQLTNPAVIAALKMKCKDRNNSLELPDFEKLPAAEHLASFFKITYQYTEKTDNGLHRRVIAPY
jgi:hypothetical protein